jgi:DNA invertase Pin-like site-specific DNA recombinase
MTKGTRVVGYVRVSTADQADSGAGLGAQRRAIADEVGRKGWELVEVIEDSGFSAKNLDRPGIQRALQVLASGQAQALVVARLDRLSRSMMDFSRLLEQSCREQWALVALDLGMDTTTPTGKAMAHMVMTFAVFERELIGQRTKDALAVKRSQGVRLGRPQVIPPELVKRMRRMRKRGASYASIAATLTADGVATAHGGQWQPTTVRNAILGGKTS